MLIQRNIDNNFSVLHVNARSLHRNLDYLQVYLRTLNHNFSVLAISETWASNDSMSLLNIPGYNSSLLSKTEHQEDVAVFLCMYAIVSNSLYVMTCLHLIMITLNQYLLNLLTLF